MCICDYESRRNRVNRKAVFIFFGTDGGEIDRPDRVRGGGHGEVRGPSIFFLFRLVRSDDGLELGLYYIIIVFHDRYMYYNDTNIHDTTVVVFI